MKILLGVSGSVLSGATRLAWLGLAELSIGSKPRAGYRLRHIHGFQSLISMGFAP